MRSKQNSAVVVLVLLLAAAIYGVYRTGRTQPMPLLPPTAARLTRSDSALAIDQSSLTTAQQLARMPTTADERRFAEDALRLADREMDLAFAQAVRNAVLHPQPLSTDAQAIDARLQEAQKNLAADQADVAQLTQALTKATGATATALSDRLDLAKAHVALDQDETDDAQSDLMRAGGDPQGRLQAMIAEHDAASKSSDSVHIAITAAENTSGLIHSIQSWDAIRQKQGQLKQAKTAAESTATAFEKRHNLMKEQAAARRQTAAATLSHDSSAALARTALRRAMGVKAKAALDQRVDDQHQLADVYAGWIGVLDAHQRTLDNRVLRGIAMILLIALFLVFADKWIEHLLGTMTTDRRQTQTLIIVTRVSLQVIGVLLILLVIFGPPDNLGTFLGLAGAGLTVALKDFIIGFFGWFVLMGKNGIRIGDLVEINGVTGEVVELGMFHTKLLETGGWSDSGHPTGRHVTFTNSFAIEGHYFNFSTSGQWLWDEIRIVVPAGRDPYPIVDAIQKRVEEVTADSARAAEQQWKGARRLPHTSALTSAPMVGVKPVIGGVEITVRFITRVAERSEVRANLYHAAVDLLGQPQASLGAMLTPDRA